MAEAVDALPPAVVRPRRLRARQIAAAAGLALFLVCLAQLLGSFSWTFGSGAVMTGDVAVVLDPGHGGADSGAVAQGVVEKELTLDVALRVGRRLEARGVKVRLTRRDDRFIPLAARVTVANALPAAIFVSIHFNDSPRSARASGIETYYSETRVAPSPWVWASLLGEGGRAVDDRECVRASQRLADSIQGALVSGTAAPDRGTKERALFVTRRVLAPAVLVEGGFVSDPAEARRLDDPGYRQRLADCIANGILKYLADPGRQHVDSPSGSVRA